MMANTQVKFNRNVKYNESLYKAGQSVAVEKKDYEAFLQAGVIDTLPGGVQLKESTRVEDPVDLYTLTREELEKLNKADLVKFLNEEQMDFDDKAKKEELVALIAGE